MDRMKKVVITGIVGIVVNLLLGGIKILVGLASNSIAIISDAVNNFTDSISSVVTILTMALVARGATKKHPFGFGRIEYFSSLIIAVLVLVTGIEFLTSSIEKILHPTATEYTMVSLVMLVVAIVGKILLGLYTKSVGTRENSPALEASGQDALSDAIITSVTLIGALITMFFEVNLDGYFGALVSVFVLKSGVDIIREVINKLVGDRPDVEIAEQIMNDITAKEGVIGAYDLILHNYGPNVFIGNVNIEIDESMTIREAYKITKPLNVEIFDKYGIFLFIGFYSVNKSDEDFMAANEYVKKSICELKHVLQTHGFYMDNESKFISFDVVVSFECKDMLLLEHKIKKIVNDKYPDYTVKITFDKDFTLSKD